MQDVEGPLRMVIHGEKEVQARGGTGNQGGVQKHFGVKTERVLEV